MQIKGKQKSYLKKLAHDTKPVVMIGGNGITEQVIKTIDIELDLKELIKIKFVDFKDMKKELFPQIAEQVNAVAVGLIGNTGILYREQSDPEKRIIKLP
jgi:RNA-binding protein